MLEMSPLHIVQVKIVSRVCEEEGLPCEEPQRVIRLWKKCVEAEGWFDPATPPSTRLGKTAIFEKLIAI